MKKRETAKEKRERLALEEQIRNDNEWLELKNQYPTILLDFVFVFSKLPNYEVNKHEAVYDSPFFLPIVLPNDYDFDVIFEIQRMNDYLEEIRLKEEYEKEKNRKIYAALAKLTKEEKELLGL
jgi:hypothetical protein